MVGVDHLVVEEVQAFVDIMVQDQVIMPPQEAQFGPSSDQSLEFFSAYLLVFAVKMDIKVNVIIYKGFQQSANSSQA